MIRKLMAGTAMFALLTAGALGAADAQTAPAAQQAAATGSGATLTPDQPTIASAYIGRSVYSSDDPNSNNIGDVNDLIIGDEGMITHAVIGVGGFLGIGEKNVAVPFDELRVVEKDNGEIRLIYAASKEQLEAAPAFDRTAYDPRQRAAETASAAANTSAAPLAPASGVDQTAIAQKSATPAASSGNFVNYNAAQMRASTIVGKELYGADDKSIGEVSDLVLDADGKTRSALVDVGGFLGIGEKRVAIPFSAIKPVAAADNAAETRLNVAMTRDQLDKAPAYVSPSEKAQTASAAAGNAQPVGALPVAGAAPATTAAATDTTAAPPAAGSVVTTDAQVNPTNAPYAPVSQDLTAENLMGAAVYGSNEDNLGKVGDVVFSPDGNIEAIVVDVGGFLGVGQKPVAVQFDALQVQRDASGNLRLKVDTTQEALQNAPSYDATASAEGKQQPAVQ